MAFESYSLDIKKKLPRYSMFKELRARVSITVSIKSVPIMVSRYTLEILPK